MMGNSNSVVNKYGKEDFKHVDEQTHHLDRSIANNKSQVKNSADYEKLIMKEYFDSQNMIINQLKEEVKKLRDSNLKLEQRVKKLEEKSVSTTTSSTTSSSNGTSAASNGLVMHSFDNFSTRIARNYDDLITLTPPSETHNNKSEIIKLKQAQDAAAAAVSANDSKHLDWDEQRQADDRIITIETDPIKSDSLSHTRSFNMKKRDSHARVQPFLVETNGKNGTAKLENKALVAARGGKDFKRISINLEQADMTPIDVNEPRSNGMSENKRNSIAAKDLNLIENSSYYGIRNEKLVKIVHK